LKEGASCQKDFNNEKNVGKHVPEKSIEKPECLVVMTKVEEGDFSRLARVGGQDTMIIPSLLHPVAFKAFEILS
jgi:hypothetical protein